MAEALQISSLDAKYMLTLADNIYKLESNQRSISRIIEAIKTLQNGCKELNTQNLKEILGIDYSFYSKRINEYLRKLVETGEKDSYKKEIEFFYEQHSEETALVKTNRIAFQDMAIYKYFKSEIEEINASETISESQMQRMDSLNDLLISSNNDQGATYDFKISYEKTLRRYTEQNLNKMRKLVQDEKLTVESLYGILESQRRNDAQISQSFLEEVANMLSPQSKEEILRLLLFLSNKSDLSNIDKYSVLSLKLRRI